MLLEKFKYNLPKELIAQEPIFPKDHSRLMIVKDKIIQHKHFYDIIDYLNKDDVLVINETKVRRTRLIGKKSTGAPAEVFILDIKGKNATAHVKSNRPKPGTILEFSNSLKAEIIEKKDNIYHLKFNNENILENAEYPFPTYIKRLSLSDKEYQPIFAKIPGSVAAPTASLHFTPEVIQKIKNKGIKIVKVCLHIDYGTFFEIKAEHVEDHKMHKEYFEITKEAADTINSCKGRLIAVGTTSLRAIESASDSNGNIKPAKTSTSIYIYPGYRFKSKVSLMITNFHLPKSSLLLLVCAFAGKERILNAYQEAIKHSYRFYSLGDATLLSKATGS
ncbi:tRNA preQ1(34) S-adenosylmethionine ribosyltransferase-isomerase QueA [Candidatus Woesearchaeota archaeon]|nr:tRNA preQ1(34) S-adenosylmethionine ribosyltransferase-isomerase QueA [Candidatus Woesearchaeota archaeon]